MNGIEKVGTEQERFRVVAGAATAVVVCLGTIAALMLPVISAIS